MTEEPEKMWVFHKADWFNAGASNVRLSSAGANDVEYTRSDIAESEAARLRRALRTMIYEITDLSPLEDDGTYWCKISDEALTSAIASVEHKD